MGNFIDRMVFPIQTPVNCSDEIRYIDNSGIEIIHIENGKRVIIFSHGNGCTLDSSIEFLTGLSNHAGCSIVSYEYPDNADESSVYKRIENVYEYVTKYYDIENIILMGHSIGSCPSVWLASRITLLAIVLIAPITSVRTQAADFVPFCGSCFAMIIKERFNNLAHIKHINSPLLIFHGEDDEVVNYLRSKQLGLMYGKDYTLSIHKAKNHNNILDYQLIGTELCEFLSQ